MKKLSYLVATSFLGAVALGSTPSLAATTIVDFAFENSGSTLATGRFSYDSSKIGRLSYSDLTLFELNLPNETYDLNFVNSGNFSQFYYFGYNATTGVFESDNRTAFQGIMSAIKVGFSDGFFVRNDSSFTVFRNYNPDSGTVSFTNVATTSRTVGGAVPEPATWAMLLLGFGFVGGAMRSAKRRPRVTVSYA